MYGVLWKRKLNLAQEGRSWLVTVHAQQDYWVNQSCFFFLSLSHTTYEFFSENNKLALIFYTNENARNNDKPIRIRKTKAALILQ